MENEEEARYYCAYCTSIDCIAVIKNPNAATSPVPLLGRNDCDNNRSDSTWKVTIDRIMLLNCNMDKIVLRTLSHNNIVL